MEDDDRVKRFLQDLGPAPPQLPRAENSNVELLLKGNANEGMPRSDFFALFAKFCETDGQKSLRPDQLYSETKYLLFTVLKAMPEISTKGDDLRGVLREIHQYANKLKDVELTGKVKRIISNCNQLVDEDILRAEDNYLNLRRDTYQEVINYEARIRVIQEDQVRLQKVLDAIRKHNDFLQNQYEAYQEYLENVRKSCELEDSKGKKSSKKEKKSSRARSASATKKGPFKFSHAQLQRDGIIIESGAPEERFPCSFVVCFSHLSRRSNIFFEFSSESPGIYDVKVVYRARSISSVRFAFLACSCADDAAP
jgi:Ras GTPase-activating-like protein IQGAP2/3